MIGALDLQWSDTRGYGFLPPKRSPAEIYTRAYYEKYVGYETNALSADLLLARLAIVRRWHTPGCSLLDVGCGSGAFVRMARAAGIHAFGCDVVPDALDALGPFADREASFARSYATLTFWDSFEHIEAPFAFAGRATKTVIVAIPVFRNRSDVLASKHFRPDEHLWYFTRRGFIEQMDRDGWECVELNDAETRIGRESIATFAFQRSGP